MADITMPSLQEVWMSTLTVGGGLLMYFLRKRDKDIDEHEIRLSHGDQERARLELKGEKEVARIELKMSEGYATKDSMRLLFQETQSANRETAARLEKQIDETKSEIKTTNTKLDNMQTAILSELAKKT